MNLEFNMQDRCLGWYFGAPKIIFSAIDRTGNKIKTNFINDVSKRVFYHFKAPTDQFYVERITPYLYKAVTETEEIKADGKCGSYSYNPIEV
jgi:hypothetical protein